MLKNILPSNLVSTLGCGVLGIERLTDLALAMNGGIAVKTTAGLKAVNEKNEVITISIENPMKDIFVGLPVMKLNRDDIIKKGESYYKIIEQNTVDGNYKAIDMSNGNITFPSVEKNELGMSFYKKVFSLSSITGLTNYGSLGEKLKDSKQLIKMVIPALAGLGLFKLLKKAEGEEVQEGNFFESMLPTIMGLGLGYGVTQVQQMAQGGEVELLPSFEGFNLTENPIVDFIKKNPIVIGGIVIGLGLILTDSFDVEMEGIREQLQEHTRNLNLDKKKLAIVGGVVAVGLFYMHKTGFNLGDFITNLTKKKDDNIVVDFVEIDEESEEENEDK